MIWGGADVIIIEIKFTINIRPLNHPQVIPAPTPGLWEKFLPRNQSLVPERLGTTEGSSVCEIKEDSKSRATTWISMTHGIKCSFPRVQIYEVRKQSFSKGSNLWSQKAKFLSLPVLKTYQNFTTFNDFHIFFCWHSSLPAQQCIFAMSEEKRATDLKKHGLCSSCVIWTPIFRQV